MTWFVTYVVDEFEDVDKIPGESILDAKRNLIAKIGSMEIKFESVVKA